MTTLSLDEEVRLFTNDAQREKYSLFGTLYGIIVALDYLERAYVRDAITAAQYVPILNSLHGELTQLFVTNLPALQEMAVLGMTRYDILTITQSISRLPSTIRSLKFIDMRPFFDIEPLSSFSPVWAHLTDVQIVVCHPNAVLQLCPNLSSILRV
ncbi:uncharacterized protein F5147DRAFT_841127 [Suillus discolor]|uniref:Uncharacterized protein n=1 Tax=Suillus discolor TaxID=1912936 RepID=A0A9P7EUV1_9AGAM|nr:uncharacterized protein F5147DRAFT_841127 [Suillus discolor]KAG2089444.1 hypothetical protein F5147DRAFT_841127 [Suillus discolor]